jgi:hypothetical protein
VVIGPPFDVTYLVQNENRTNQERKGKMTSKKIIMFTGKENECIEG